MAVIHVKRRLSLMIKFIAFSFIALSLAGCHLGMLNPKGSIAAQQTHLFVVTILLMMIVVIPVFFMVIYFGIKYRASNKKTKYTPNWAHSTILELIWWGVPFVIILILGIITWVTSHTLSPYRPITTAKEKPITIQVVALRWKWLFIYPKLHIATVNFVEFPENKPVRFLITADAPMNSFMIPQLGGQIYAMTGMQTQLHLIANAKGDYYGMSANYSGDGFSGMHFTARASSENEFKAWVHEVKQSAQRLSFTKYHQLAKPSHNNKPQYFSYVQPDLFKTIIFKYTKPTVHEKFKKLI